ncbi:HAMP domain-containing histidine kinase [Ornithinimicrobium sp. F0845]|uniref:sensor histidine kinase n=1 Tax=Ornithinimicrobium sp. F0845 TaxID=2926412 RepID=UPI001FF65BD5|nr:HAMP domain-containing sensor histidine kinase [Ornithinimicrobium sp. F0845]MCK0114177.1 HAMP domain-containing histidine kinase [Ornithinimicrobium sp. F0845]
MAARVDDLDHLAPDREERPAGRLRRLVLSGLSLRVLGALVLVIVVAVGTLWVVDTILETRLFAEGSTRASRTPDAFRSANTFSGLVAILVSLVVALILSLLIAQRLDRLVHGVVAAAARIASGDFALRVPSPRLGRDVDALVNAFNVMADQLQTVELTRKQLLGDLAHELRTPIATLDAYLEAAEDGVAEFDEQTLTVLRAQTQRLARLADDIGAVSRAEERVDLKFAPVAIEDVVNTTVVAATPLAQERGVDLHREIGRDLPVVQGDAQRLEQVLTNLLDNALRHTPGGGSVTVHVTRGTDMVRVEVRDTGRGIAPKDLPHITMRFYRGDEGADERPHGSGVGLTIATAIVRAHHGDLRVHSSGPGLGTTVMFWLPTTRRPGAPAGRRTDTSAGRGTDISADGRTDSRSPSAQESTDPNR